MLSSGCFWLLASVLGAVFGAGAYFIFPPDYRAQVTVVVDFNLEESLLEGNDRDLFYYLERESRKLEEVAWADETVDAISQEIADLTVTELRDERLQLSQPQDGAWHFYANDADPAYGIPHASIAGIVPRSGVGAVPDRYCSADTRWSAVLPRGCERSAASPG